MANKFFLYKYEEGDTVTMKKAHPCGSREWEVLRVGADFRLRCRGCGHEVMGARAKFEKNVRRVERAGEESGAAPG